jgi:hypothetical protein
MNDIDAAYAIELQARVSACQMAVQLAREDLIERLGDHMCGGRDGPPDRADLKMLARARRGLREAQHDLAQYLAASTLKTLGAMEAAPVMKSIRPKPILGPSKPL